MKNSKLFSFHATISLILPILPLIKPELLTSNTIVLIIYTIIFFTFFYFNNQIKPYRLADGITSLRLFIAVFLLIIIPLNTIFYIVIFLIILFAEILDGLDGKIARKTGPTQFGATWDMETDAWFILSLSYITVFYLRYPWWILGYGLIRYLFYFIYFYLKPANVKFPTLLSMFSKTICVSTVLILALFWVISVEVGSIIGLINLLLLIISFLWEGIYYFKLRSQTKKR